MSCLMVQGTTSDAGKSALVTGLCRILKRRGIRVAPFKPQNMALNSAVTIDGGEIGRAQALQAYAAGIEPHTDMNPVLLKPTSDTGSQVIIQGRAVGNMKAREYHEYKRVAREAVLDSFQRLRKDYDVVLVEGAGSPAEINLRSNDIANMGFAQAVNCPVMLVADIDRGGVFAHLYGTLALLDPEERRLVKGMFINRFRGDVSLLQTGIDWLERKTQVPVLGVIPFLQNLHLEAEDSLNRNAGKEITRENQQDSVINIVIPALPRMSNHTDFDALALHPQVNLKFIPQGQVIPAADLIILPGSKSVRDDLAWLRDNLWEDAVKKHLRYGGKLIGICGGYQMLGNNIHDPMGIEGSPGTSQGLGLLDVSTRLEEQKQLRNVSGKLFLKNVDVHGYEIHMGVTTGPATKTAAIQLEGCSDGAVSQDGNLFGTYFHGLFDSPTACRSLLNWAGLKRQDTFNYLQMREVQIDRLADTLEQHLDIETIMIYLESDNQIKTPSALMNA